MLPVFSMKDILESSSSPAAMAAPSKDGSRSKLIAIDRRVPEKERTNGIMVGVDLSRASIHFLDRVSDRNHRWRIRGNRLRQRFDLVCFLKVRVRRIISHIVEVFDNTFAEAGQESL